MSQQQPSNPASDRNEAATAAGRELVPELTKAGVLFLLAHRKECPVPSITIREALVEIEAEATERAIGAALDVAALHALERDLAWGKVNLGEVWERLRTILDKPGQDALLARLATPQPGEPR